MAENESNAGIFDDFVAKDDAPVDEPAPDEIDAEEVSPDEDIPDDKPEPKGKEEREAEPEAKLDAEGKPIVKKVAPVPIEEQKVKVKILGQEREVVVKDLVRGYQKAEAADKRFQEAAQHKANAERFFATLLQNPWAAFEFARQDPYAAAERMVWNRFVESRMTPEQRTAYRAQQRLSQLEAREHEFEQQQREAMAHADAERAVDTFAPVLEHAIEKYQVPETDYAQQKLIDYLFADLNDGIEPDPAYLAERVNQDLMKELGALRSLPPEKLAELLGDETAKKVAQARAKAGKVRPSAPKSFTPADKKESAKGYVSEDDFDAEMARFTKRGA